MIDSLCTHACKFPFPDLHPHTECSAVMLSEDMDQFKGQHTVICEMRNPNAISHRTCPMLRPPRAFSAAARARSGSWEGICVSGFPSIALCAAALAMLSCSKPGGGARAGGGGPPRARNAAALDASAGLKPGGGPRDCSWNLLTASYAAIGSTLAA